MAEACFPLTLRITATHFRDLPFFVKQSFLELTKPAYGGIINKAAIATLCGEDELSRDIDLTAELVETENWSVLKGYPGSPMVLRFARCLLVWMDRDCAELCPALQLPEMYLLNESEEKQRRILRLDQGWEVINCLLAMSTVGIP